MNERIKELVEQAWVNIVTTKGIEDVEDGCIIVHPDALERFVELIGRDMLKLANRHGNIKEHSVNEYFGFEKDFGINTNNIKRFVDERTN